jgi:hypothetical protein
MPRRRIDRIVLVGLAAGALIGVGTVWAQDAATSARALTDTQSGALQAGPTTAPSGGSVPGFAGESPALQSLSADPTALQAAGSAAAMSGTPQYGIALDGLTAPGRAGINAGDTWLDRSLAAHSDPMSLVNAGGTTTTGSESQACRSETRSDTQTSTSLYTCESTTTIAIDTRVCTESYQPKVTDYGATCTETFNSGAGRFEASPACSTAAADRNCSAGPRICTTPSTPVVSSYDCQSGYTETSSTAPGSYDCQEGYVAAAAPASCTAAVVPDIQYGSIAGPCALPSPLYPFNQCHDAWGMPRAGCVMIDESYDAAGGHWATFACDPYDAGGTIDASACQGMTSCEQVGTTCTSGPATYVYDGVAVHRDCWAWRYDYSCPGGRTDAPGCAPPSGAVLAGSDCAAYDATGGCTEWNRHYQYTSTTTTQTPAAGCSPGAGCSLIGSDCAATDASGNCTALNQHFSCTSDPAGGCAQWQTSYACRGDTGGAWVSDGACPAAADAACHVVGAACLAAAATRVVDGANVYADCWRRQTNYSCKAYSTTDDCDPEPGCTKTDDNCLDEPPGPDGCLAMDHVYECVATTTTTTTVDRCESRMCLGDSCFTLSKDQNGDFAQVYSQLAAMDQAGKDYATNPDFTIFKGKPLRCKKAVLGFANCCKDSGWGISIGLARCDEVEKELIAEQDKKATHYIGAYCSNKSLFGVCLEKAMSYCGFGAPMPRILQEAGRPQVGKGWGAPKTPDCSGFSVEEFQRLDLSNVDFSDFYREKLAGFAPPGEGGTVSSIQNSLQALYDAATPRTRPDE